MDLLLPSAAVKPDPIVTEFIVAMDGEHLRELIALYVEKNQIKVPEGHNLFGVRLADDEFLEAVYSSLGAADETPWLSKRK